MLTLAAAVLLLSACGGPGYSSTRGARIARETESGNLVHQDLHPIEVVPRIHGRWELVLLHGRGAGPEQFLSQPFFDTLAALGKRAPIVFLLDGGDHSYWHNRADGDWGLVVQQAETPLRSDWPVAIGGISMGGYGALLASARSLHFCATAVMSPALWTSAGATAPGAFDDAEDYAKNDVFKLLKPPSPLWIAIGTSDPFHDATLTYARQAGVTAHVSPGGHDSTFWNAHIGALLRFAAHACA